MALENFIDSNLHPRFVYFSDYKKIIGNVNLNEYRKERTSPSIEFSEEEFDKADTVDNLFYLAGENYDNVFKWGMGIKGSRPRSFKSI